MDNIDKAIGINIKEIRNKYGLSMDQVANLTGVSKSMIARIEKGVSTPTITTLWKLCNGLKISFTSLISDKEETGTIVNKEDLTSVKRENLYSLFPLIKFDVNRKIELYNMELHKNAEHFSEPHIGAIEEFIYVIKGNIELIVDEKISKLTTGDLFRFIPANEHIYKNSLPEKAEIIVVILYS